MGAKEGLGLAPPLPPCANNTTPSFTPRPLNSTPRSFAYVLADPSGFTPHLPARLYPPERDCGGDAARAVGYDTCSNASSGQGCFHRGYGGVSLPPSSRHPPPCLSELFHFGRKGSEPSTPACWRSWHVQRAWRGSGLWTHRGPQSASFSEKGGPRASGAGEVRAE